MKKLIAVIALTAGMGVAYADEPVALTDAQMDQVSAAGTATSISLANAFGITAAATATLNQTWVSVLAVIPTQAGQLTVDQTYAASSSAAGSL